MAWKPTDIVVHHSASRFGDVPTIRRWHLERGYSDIGYHAVILNGCRQAGKYEKSLDGHISGGRSELIRGAHCVAGGMNNTALGVCLVGDSTQEKFSDAQIGALIHWLATKCRAYGIPYWRITQHSDHDKGKPYCAGLDMREIRRRVAAKLKTME